MTRIVMLSLLFLGLHTPRCVSVETTRPNILMIAVDDLRPMLGCYGDPHIRTPNIDRLAKKGVLFEHAYCQYAKCGTSRLSLMTGLRPDSIGVFSNNARDVARFRKRRPGVSSLARWLKQQGYHTRGFGKIYHDGWDTPDDWSVPAAPGRPTSPGRPGEMLEIVDVDAAPGAATIIADRYACPVKQSPEVPDDHLFAGRMTRDVVRCMKQHDVDKPLFLAVGYRRPHLPFVAPRRYFDMYRPDSTWLAKNPAPSADAPLMSWFNSDGYVGSAKRVGLSMPVQPTRHEAIDWNGYEMRSYLGVPNHGPIETHLQLELLQAYAACVTYVDAQIGLLLDELERREEFENTIVVFWSDHGWHLGEHSAWGKMTNYEIATRVPLLVSAPGIASKRTGTLAELVDLYPTICDLAKTASPPHLEGESLLPILEREAKDVEGGLSTALSQYTRFRGRFMGRALRTERFRYIAWFDRDSDVDAERVVERELYDHQTDPHEMQNLSGDPQHAQLVIDLEKQLKQSFQLR